MKKGFKYTLVVIASLFAILLIGAAIVVNFVLTPSKLTPIVLEQANKHLDAQVLCDEVDITVFSTFPRIGIRLKNGSVISHTANDSLSETYQDSLLQFKTCLVTANPLALLVSNQVNIHTVLIDEATIYAYKNKNGIANWDIVALNQQAAADTVVTDSAGFDSSIEIGNIEIRQANVTFDDRSTELFADLRNFNFKLSGSLSDVKNQVKLHLDAKNILLWQQGKLLVNKLGFGFDTRLMIDRKELLYQLDDTSLDVNGIKMSANGTLRKDTASNNLDVDFAFGLQVPELKTVLDLIPTSIVNEAVDMKANGAVEVNGTLKGIYGSNRLPVFDAIAKIDNASAQYKGMAYGIDRLDLDLQTHINFEEQENSYVQLHNFRFEGASSTLICNGEVVNPIGNPRINMKVDANIDFDNLAKTFPLEEGVELKGKVDSKLRANVLLSDIKQQNWGKLGVDGLLKLSDVAIISPKDTFDLRVATAGLAFGANHVDTTLAQGTSLLNAIIGFDGLHVQTRGGLQALMNNATLQVKTSPLKDTTSIASMEAKFGFSKMNLTLSDTVKLNVEKAQTTFAIEPSKRNNKLPYIRSTLKFDSVYAASGNNVVALQIAGFEVNSQQSESNAKHWITEGSIGFGNLKMFTPAFPLLISMPASKLSLVDDAIRLNQAKVKIGSSDMSVTGSISNLKNVFFDRAMLYGKMNIYSSFINCNEIMKALEINQESTVENSADMLNQPTPTVASDNTTQPSLFIVPDGIDFTLDVDLKKVLFGKIELENIKGEMLIRNQSIEVADLNLHTMAADMNTTLVYTTKDSTSAYTGFDIRMEDIQVGKLVEFIPALDSLVPMLRSLDGTVNFQIAAEAKLDTTMSVDIASVQAAARLKGNRLVLMDGETFSEISKMLRFKNKERNVIDSVAVDLIVRNGQIEIYPFLIGMDRYLAAVGGKHNIDMTYDYHVSLLKSPIPFNVGVDIKGNMEDFKFRITKAKYKDMKKSVRQSPVDSAGVSVRQRIKEVLHEEAKSVKLDVTPPKVNF